MIHAVIYVSWNGTRYGSKLFEFFNSMNKKKRLVFGIDPQIHLTVYPGPRNHKVVIYSNNNN